jgi:hypothetical protein
MTGKPPQQVVNPAELRQRAAHYQELAVELVRDAETLRAFAVDYVEMAETLESGSVAGDPPDQ